MPIKSKAIVFIGMTYPYGAIRHFALLGVELYKCSPDGCDFYYASIEREPNKGSWEIVRNRMPNERIICTKTFDELVEESIKLASKYQKVIIHTGGGWGQTKHFVKARNRIDKMLAERLIFIGTTHSYRNDSFLRIPMSAFQYVLYRLYYRLIVFQCQYAADKFVGGNDLIRRGRGVVIPLGCEPFAGCDNNVPDGIAANTDLVETLKDTSLFKFVYLAAFRPGKMHVWLVNAFAPVLKANPCSRVILCGTGDNDVIDETKRAIKKHELCDQIILPGQIRRDEIPWVLTHCNCAVVPSRAETFGHNFLEPMFAGLPVLGTAVGIGRDIIKDGETGYVFKLKDPDMFRAQAEKMMVTPLLTSIMGKKAKELVSQTFTHAAVAKRLMKVYIEL